MILNDRDALMNTAFAFIENPSKYIFSYGSSGYFWPEISGSQGGLIDVRDMYFKMPTDAKPFAYVQGVICCEGVATVNHLAVEVGYERLGIGRALVGYLVRELNARCRVHTVRFTESRPRAHDKEFFESLGATGVFRPPLTTPDWELPARKMV